MLIELGLELSVDDEGDEEECSSNISNAGEVADMIGKCMDWYEQQSESDATSMLLLKKIRDFATNKRYSNLKQQKIQSFFS